MSEDAESLDLPIVPVPAIFKGDAAPAPEVVEVEYFLRCEECSIKKLPVPVYTTDKVPDLAPFHAIFNQLTELTGIDDVKYQTVIIGGFSGGDNAEPVFQKAVENKCDIVGVNCVEPNVCTFFCRRTAPRAKFKMEGIVFNQLYVVKFKGTSKESSNRQLVQILKAWMQSGSNYKVNFEIDDTPTEMTVADLKDEWATMTKEEMESQILEAEEKLKCKRPHTSRESFIAMMGRTWRPPPPCPPA